MGISREKDSTVADSKRNDASLNSINSSHIEPGSPHPDQAGALFWLKLSIVGIIALNLLFAFYALKSDRFVTQPSTSESDSGNGTPSESIKIHNEVENITVLESVDSARQNEIP